MTSLFSIVAIQYDISFYIINFSIVVLIVFICFTLIASYLRFQDITNNLEEKNQYSDQDLLHLIVAKILSESVRKKESFIVAKLHIDSLDDLNISKTEVIDYLRNYIREIDKIISNEAYEYIILRCDKEEYEGIISRIIKIISNHFPKLKRDNISVGLACFPIHGTTTIKLLDEADEALKEARDSNRIIFRDDESMSDEEEEDNSQNKSNEEKILNPITGVLNEKTLSKFIQREVSELRLKKQSCIILCIQINNINDITHIHNNDLANEFLLLISNAIQDNVRNNDIIGSYDHSNFMLLLHASISQADSIARRIHTDIQNKKYEINNIKLRPLISLALTACPEHGNNLFTLFKKAQKTLNYCNENDISGYLMYDDRLHNNLKKNPKRSIKSKF